MVKIDFHVHSYHSLDSRQKFETILDRIESKGLDGVVIVDHNVMEGKDVLEALVDSRYHHVPIKDRPIIIRGVEYSTEEGHIIVIGLTTPLESLIALDGAWYRREDVIREAKKQNAYIVLAHPYRWKRRVPSEALLSSVDAIEVFNGRTCFVKGNVEANAKAVQLAKSRNLPIVGGSDGHTFLEIGTSYVAFDVAKTAFDPQNLKAYPSKVFGTCTCAVYEVYSQIYKMVTQKNYKKIPRQLMKAVYAVAIYWYSKINTKAFLQGWVAEYTPTDT